MISATKFERINLQALWRRARDEGKIVLLSNIISRETVPHGLSLFNCILQRLYRTCALVLEHLFIRKSPNFTSGREKYEKLWNFLHGIDKQVAHLKPFRNWGDHFFVVMKKL